MGIRGTRLPTMICVISVPAGDDWTGLSEQPLPVESAYEWLVRPDCGATVVFTGTARDHSDGRESVEALTYEAYEAVAVRRLDEVLEEARSRWPDLGRLLALHRLGDVPVGSAAVVVGASSAHRDTAFVAARFCIDAVKATVPLWKLERHAGGQDWGLDGADLTSATELSAVEYSFIPQVDRQDDNQ